MRRAPSSSGAKRAARATSAVAARLHVVFPPKHRRIVELGREPLRIGRAVADGLSIEVPSLSRTHLALEWDEGRGCHRAQDAKSRHGSVVNGQALGDSPVLLNHNAVLRLADVVLVYEVTPPFRSVDATDAFLGSSVAAHRLRDAVARAAPGTAPVLVLGEPGAGKKSAAGEIQRLSGRRGPLLVIHCASDEPRKLERQLFGHVKGAITGADAVSPGLFHAAQGRALLLDEVGALSLDLQPKLLRALEQKEVLPVGATSSVKVDVRVIATTSRALKAEVDRGAFRRDLHARLSLNEVFVPPLRERRADILGWLGLLDRQWRSQRGLGHHLELDSEAAEGVLLSPLAENLRALERLAQELAKKPMDHEVTVGDLPASLAKASGNPAEADLPLPPARRAPPSREDLATALERLGSVRATARYFGRDRRQIYRWIEAWSIEWRGAE